jgi:hypothetical protein
MPTIKDQIGDIAGAIGNADPAVQISRGIAKVGETVEPYVTQAKDWVQKKLAPTPPPTDIELPKEGKRKKPIARPVTRSLSR